LGLSAFAKFHSKFPHSEYWIAGDGPERSRLRALAKRLGIEQAVIFWGVRPRSELLSMLAECDILLHPSLHDSGGWVCLEMMAAGRPIVCLNLGGPAAQVTEQTGFKVDANDPSQATTDLAEALLRLACAPSLRLNMSSKGRAHVRENFSWNKKGEWMNGIYGNISEHSI
jgi:glycosyltransferase involved in cell wall biosynthesis